MSPQRSRRMGLATAVVMSLMGLSFTPAAHAAESPEAAVQQLLDSIDSGDFAALEGLVCEAERAEVRELFDVAAALGIPDTADAPLAAFDFSAEDRSIELLEQGDESATVRVAATLRVDLDEESARELVRRMLEAEGTPVSEEELAMLVPLMSDLLGQGQRIDEELELVREADEWLICGGLGEAAVGSPEASPSISFEGLCGLVSLAEVNAAGPDWLAFDSSEGQEDVCSYFSSVHDLGTLTLAVGSERLDDYRALYPEGSELSVAGRPAWQHDEQLQVELADGVLSVLLFTGDEAPPEVDVPAYLTSIGELIVPQVVELQAEEASPEPVDEVAAWPDPEGPSLCEAASVEEISEATGIEFSESFGSPESCTYSAVSETAYQVASTNLYGLTLDEFRLVFPGGEDVEVGGMPGYAQADQVWVQLPGEGRLLGVGVFLTPGTDADAPALARSVAELVLPPIGELQP